VDYIPIDLVPTNVRFENPHLFDVLAAHLALADGAGAVLDASSSSAQPTIDAQPDAAISLADHETLHQVATDGWVQAAADQQALSVDEQLAQDPNITGAVGSGEHRTYGSTGTAPAGSMPQPDQTLQPVTDVQSVVVGNRDKFTAAAAGRPVLASDELPWDAINSATAARVAPITNQEIADAQTVRELRSRLDDLSRASSSQAAAGAGAPIPGPPGPPGPPGDPGPPGPAGPPGQVHIVI
jgi:hypothetical protein